MVTYDHYSEYLKINFGNSTELDRRITRTLTLDKVYRTYSNKRPTSN